MRTRILAGLRRHVIDRSSLQIVRFGIGGVFNTAAGYVLLLLLLALNVPTPIALALTTFAGIIINFQTSRLYIFQSREKGRMIRFAAVYLTLFQLNWLGLMILRHLGLHDWAAQALLTVPLALLSYAGQHLLVFMPAERRTR